MSRNKTLSPSFLEGIIQSVVEQSDGTVYYRVIGGLDEGTSLDAYPIKQNKGSFYRYKEGDNVLCLKIPTSNGGLYILGGKETFRDNPPRLEDPREMILSNDFGEFHISDPEKNGLSLTQGKSGIKIVNHNQDSSAYSFFDNKIEYTSSGFTYAGKAKLVFDRDDCDNYLSNNSLNSFGFNFDYHKNDVLGEYGGEEVRIPGILFDYKNKPVVYTRSVFNDHSNNWQGEDKEFASIKDFSDSIGEADKVFRNINSRTNFSYTLDLAPNQIGETIWGTVFDLDGLSLDSNYKKINNYKPKSSELYYRHNELRKRAIGYHFQLSTKKNSDIDYNIEDNFIASINKEGLLYLNVPSTSDTGTIPFESSVSFNDNPFSKSRISSKIVEPSSEAIPVVTNVIVDSKYLTSGGVTSNFYKDMCIPEISKLRGSFYRSEGIGVYGIESYSKDSSASSRVKMTKHHNMYAAAEKLFSNKVIGINSDVFSGNDCNLKSGNSLYKTFEFPVKFIASTNAGTSNLPDYMSTVTTKASLPAINTGGGVSVCGMSPEEVNQKPLSNYFYYEGDKKKYPENTTPAGNISAKLNFDGSVIANFGKDLHDEKSIMMDCAGSMICWLGKDKNNRSAVIQTDGDFALNIGGRSNGIFNSGRLDIRVNVSDKGTVEEANENLNNKKDKSSGDYIISISEAGLVIAGMNSKPMMFRNDGDITIESANGKVRINAGESIIKREGASSQKNIAEDQKTSDDKVSDLCSIAEAISAGV